MASSDSERRRQRESILARFREADEQDAPLIAEVYAKREAHNAQQWIEKAQPGERVPGSYLEPFIQLLDAHITKPIRPSFAGHHVGMAGTVKKTLHLSDKRFGKIDLTVEMSPPERERPRRNLLSFSWKANVQGVSELRIVLFDPATRELLGAPLRFGPPRTRGAAGFTQTALGFDPTRQNWSIALLFIPFDSSED